MKKAIMISLGHSSSAIFYDGVNKPIGYEEERLNGIKSSSAFPILSIKKIIEEVSVEDLNDCTVFVSHWFDSFDLAKAKDKYYDHGFMEALCNDYNMNIIGVDQNFTHHDAHAYSSLAFLESSIQKNDLDIHYQNEPTHFIVADGFGNLRETLSIYVQYNRDGDLTLLHRSYGYKTSLGLLYQFATAFCGMKENQDEYKFLGYESLVTDLGGRAARKIDKLATDIATKYADDLELESVPYKSLDSFIDLDALQAARDKFNGIFKYVLDEVKETIVGVTNHKLVDRIIIGHFIQKIVERALVQIVDGYMMKNVCLSGGCFYNVKLNNAILNAVDGFVSVVPVAGDQGAAIGMYRKHIGHFNFYDLCYGNRQLLGEAKNPKILVTTDRTKFVEKVVDLLNEDKIVNIVTGAMEFGPRALCNTSTLAAPSEKNVEYINTMNGRNTVMPMAPVLLESNMVALFGRDESYNRVIGSNEYMVMTQDFMPDAIASKKYRGVMHPYPYPRQSEYSGRPQIITKIDERPIRDILRKTKHLSLINTSFNTHGTPILYSFEDCVRDFEIQCREDKENRNYLVFLADE